MTAPSSYQGKRIVVTGGSGYIGSMLISRLRKEGAFVKRFIRIQSDHTTPASSEDTVADLSDASAWERIIRDVDCVFHLAAQTNARFANEHPQDDFAANVMPLITLLQVCKKQKRILHIVLSSTVTIAGLTDNLPVSENAPEKPVTVYDIHKLAAEKYLFCYIHMGVVSGTILRLANVYGPGQKQHTTGRGVLNSLLSHAVQGHPLTIYGTGLYLRDYIYITDVVHAFLLAGEKISAVNGKRFIISSGKGYSMVEAVEVIRACLQQKFGRNVEAVYPKQDDMSAIDRRNFIGNSALFHQAVGWSPTRSLPAGIEQTIDFYKTASEDNTPSD